MSVAFYPQQDNCVRVADAARQAGFAEWLIATVVAIARAESNCSPAATLSTSREHSVGPFQLNLMAHPSISEDCARDFVCSARQAYHMSGGGRNFSPWTTFTSGRYLQFLGGPATPEGGSGFAPQATPAPLLRVVVLVAFLVLFILGVSALKEKPIKDVGGVL